MSELDDAIAMLERAVARLEAGPERVDRLLDDRRTREAAAAAVAARVDAALARIDRLLGGEG